MYPAVNFRGIERGLFAPADWPGGYANARGFSGRVFGARAFTNEFGFRVDSTGGRRFDARRDTVLILGDSVSFGVGVEDGKTFADLLAGAWPEQNVLNASVIGYGLEDYLAALPTMLDTSPVASRVRAVILGICLNDGAPSSKAAILAQVARERGEQPTAGSDSLPSGAIDSALAATNAFLRERSKLYLVVKSAFRDAAAGYFLADRPFYDDGVAVQGALKSLDNIAAVLSGRGISLTVIVFPYAYQLRSGNDALVWLPQKILLEHFAAKAVPAIDLAAAMQGDHAATGRPYADYFLFDDPMHLSEFGHEIAARSLLGADRR